MFPEVTVAGPPFERGRAYGAAVAPLVRHSIASYARLFACRRGLDWAATQAEAMRFTPLLAEVAPDLLEELRGIAAGAGRSLAEIVALNVRTELLAGVPSGTYHPDGPAALARNRAAGVPEHPPEDPRAGDRETGRAGERETRDRRPGDRETGRPGDRETRDRRPGDRETGRAGERETRDRRPGDQRREAGRREAGRPGDGRPGTGDASGDASGLGPRASRPAPHDDGECTTVAAAGPATAAGGTILAQTWDWTGDQRAACVLLRVRAPGEPTILTMTEAGMVAKLGLNSAGLAVGLNLLRSRADGRQVGLPVHILLRKVLQAGSLAEALAAARLAPPSGSSCVTVASATGDLVSLELTPAGVAEVGPEGGLLAHANHCVDEGAMAGECPLDPASTSRERAGRAWELLRAGRGALDVAAMQAILRDHAGEPRCICRHPDLRVARLERSESICGVVIDLAAGVMHVAPNVPCLTEFSAVAL